MTASHKRKMLILDQKVVKVIRLNEQKESSRVFAANYDVGKIQINSIIRKNIRIKY